jgi:methionyl-tRNA formyltransferase
MNAAEEVDQDESLATYAPKVTRDDSRVDWNLASDEVIRIIRAYDPKPAAFTTLNGTDVKLFGARAASARSLQGASLGAPGDVIQISEGIIVSCADGPVCIRDVQPAGRTRMRSAEWARGRGISVGDSFGP